MGEMGSVLRRGTRFPWEPVVTQYEGGSDAVYDVRRALTRGVIVPTAGPRLWGASHHAGDVSDGAERVSLRGPECARQRRAGADALEQDRA